jgi:hypothetical protein
MTSTAVHRSGATLAPAFAALDETKVCATRERRESTMIWSCDGTLAGWDGQWRGGTDCQGTGEVVQSRAGGEGGAGDTVVEAISHLGGKRAQLTPSFSAAFRQCP